MANGCDNDTGPEHVAGGCLLAILIGIFFWLGVAALVGRFM